MISLLYLFVLLILLVSIVILVIELYKRKHHGNADSCNPPKHPTTASYSDYANLCSSYMANKGIQALLPKSDFDALVASAPGSDTRENKENLLMLAFANYASKHATVPVSGYKVGACAKGTKGYYFGCNYEFADYPLSMTVHGEQSSIMNAFMNKETKVTKLAVNEPPCGYCRQFLVELGNPKDLTLVVPVSDKDARVITYTLEELLPENFGPANLGLNVSLFAPRDKKLTIANPPRQVDAVLLEAATNAASRSYSPYTNISYGLVVKLSTMLSFSMPAVENAAYNPSLTPMRALLSLLKLYGQNPQNITNVITVVEKQPDGQCKPCFNTDDIKNKLVSVGMPDQVVVMNLEATSPATITGMASHPIYALPL